MTVCIGNIGVVLTVDVGIDVSSAYDTYLSVQKPDGTTADWVAIVSAPTKLQYTTQEFDLDSVGKYYIQAVVSMCGQTIQGETFVLEVSKELL